MTPLAMQSAWLGCTHARNAGERVEENRKKSMGCPET